MSLMAATSVEGGIFQYCTYGYDTSKYTSREDCMQKQYKENGLIYNGLFGKKPINLGAIQTTADYLAKRSLIPTEKYVFLKEYKTAYIPYIVPPSALGGVPPLPQTLIPIPITFKKGDVIDGIYIIDQNQSENNSIETTVNGVNGNLIRIPEGNRGQLGENRIIQPVNNKPIAVPIGKDKQKQTTEPTTLFTTKNIVIAVVVAGAVFGILKWRKII